ncbi:hypothetical protein SFUMM280S_10009 [Streptomyces fumanus]
MDLPEAAVADPVGAAVGAFADEGAAVDAVHAPVLLADPEDRDRTVQFHQGQPRARLRGEDHLPVLRTAGGDRLDRGHARPVPLLDAQLAHPGRRDQTAVDRLDLVRAVLAQPRVAVGVDGVLHARAPRRDLAGRHLVALGGHHRAVPARLLGREPGQPPQLLGDHLALEAALGARLGVLPVAAAAAAGPGEGTGGLDPVLGGGEDLDGVRAQEAGALLALGDPGHDPLTGQRVPDEQHLPLGRTGDAVAAVGDGADLDLVLLPDQRRFLFCLHGGVTPVTGTGRQRTTAVQSTSGPRTPSSGPGGAGGGPDRAGPRRARSTPAAGGPAAWPPRRTGAGTAPRSPSRPG